MNKHTFHVSGTHCSSCKILIEDILGEQGIVNSVKVNLSQETIEVDTNSDILAEELLKLINEKVKPNGYNVTLEKGNKIKENHNILFKAIPIGLLFLILFFLLQKSGILNLGIGGGVTPASGFIIGLIASVSSCLAVVGGLVLSLSAKIAEDNRRSTEKQVILFHIGRLVGFALLGGVLGLVGQTIGINFTFSAILGIIASTIMLLLGMNLIGVFKKTKFTLPSNIFKYFRKVEHATLAPIILGIGTFFLPCGFTQSMQFSALSSGSFISGFSIMFFFALGTLPVLAILSFSSVSFAKSKYAPLFFKSTGVIVIGLGLFSLLAGLTGLGVINPLFNL